MIPKIKTQYNISKVSKLVAVIPQWEEKQKGIALPGTFWRMFTINESQERGMVL